MMAQQWFKPTHKVLFYGIIPCWWNDAANELQGMNWLCDVGVIVLTGFHKFFGLFFSIFGELGFPMTVVETYGPSSE